MNQLLVAVTLCLACSLLVPSQAEFTLYDGDTELCHTGADPVSCAESVDTICSAARRSEVTFTGTFDEAAIADITSGLSSVRRAGVTGACELPGASCFVSSGRGSGTLYMLTVSGCSTLESTGLLVLGDTEDRAANARRSGDLYDALTTAFDIVFGASPRVASTARVARPVAVGRG